MTALSENLTAFLLALLGFSNLVITRPVRMPTYVVKRKALMLKNLEDMFTSHDHARETLQEGEEDDDRTLFVDVPSPVPDAITIE